MSEIDVYQERIDQLESQLCVIAFDCGFQLGEYGALRDDGLDRDGFVNMTWRNVRRVFQYFCNVDHVVRMLGKGFDAVFDASFEKTGSPE